MEAIVRTPDEHLSHVPEFPFKPKYRKHDGLRLAYVDEGKGPPVVFIHGEPTWSFLWRKVIPPIRDAGYRCIAPDLPGFGRSDKPLDIEWYTYDRHTASVATLLGELKLHDATIVVHDWGGPIGLRVAVEHPDRVGRMVLLDTGLFTGHQKMSDAWMAFRGLAQPQRGPAGFVPDPGRVQTPPPAPSVVAAYEAPFPTPASKAGARAFPLISAHLAADGGRRDQPARARSSSAPTRVPSSSSGARATRSFRSSPASGSPARSAPTSTT